ncbi:transcriptional repressor, partial [Aliarcobacter butzleri]|uniref:transcriptional repressor n=1 Tax=Aliarcobacter butzleri TaxID=28197 RepID=UPI003ADAE1CB
MEISQEMAVNIFLGCFIKNVPKVGSKNTIQKDYILKTLYLSKKHLTADDIFLEIKVKYNMSVVMGTIYNAIKF